MKRQWQVRRTTVEVPQGQQRWDQVYQLLLRWALTDEEVLRARSGVCPRLDDTAGAAADD